MRGIKKFITNLKYLGHSEISNKHALQELSTYLQDYTFLNWVTLTYVAIVSVTKLVERL